MKRLWTLKTADLENMVDGSTRECIRDLAQRITDKGGNPGSFGYNFRVLLISAIEEHRTFLRYAAEFAD